MATARKTPKKKTGKRTAAKAKAKTGSRKKAK